MKRARVFLSFLVLLTISDKYTYSQDSTEDPVSKLRLQFEKELLIVDRPLIELNEKYRQYLQKQKAAYQKRGALKALLAIDEELNSYEASPSENLSSYPELKRLQEIYRKQRTAHEVKTSGTKLKLIRSFAESAENLARDLTRAGKIDEAKSALDTSETFIAMAADLHPDESADAMNKDSRAVGGSSIGSEDPERELGENLPALPPERRRVFETGGNFHIWGFFDGAPLSDSLTREITRTLRERDYTKVVVGLSTYYMEGQHTTIAILAVRKNGEGTLVTIPTRKFYENGAGLKVSEFRAVQHVDYNGHYKVEFIADKAFLGNPRTENIGELPLDEKSWFTSTQDFFILREAEGVWRAFGARKRYLANFGKLWDAECKLLTADKAQLATITINRLLWINERNQFRYRHQSTSGDFESVNVDSQPEEPIVYLSGASRVYGNWIAIGSSGKIYAEKLGGFKQPAEDWPLARAIRIPGNFASEVVALQKLDGSWEARGKDDELRGFLSKLGPAIDLDVCIQMEKGKIHQKIVVWAEPEKGLR
ncbi:MAG: hypothetical protein P1V20_30025 [Verrucomicrobiales bacterium]|nr:hypothetical protein [Verrucomicrobiales bacterium]